MTERQHDFGPGPDRVGRAGLAALIVVQVVMLGAPTAFAGGAAATAALLALVSLGPQKWVDPAVAEIWPAILVGQAAAAIVLVRAIGGLGGRKGRA